MPLSTDQINQFVESSYDKKGTPSIGDYQLDKELSTRKAKVYYNPNDGKVVVANRGTAGTVSDWANNARWIAGTYDESDRMKQAEQVQRQAIAKYGKVDTNVTHSQSGIIGRKLNEKGLTGQVISVNPASMFEKQKKNEYVIRSSSDPVSMLHAINPFARPSRTKTIKAKTWNPFAEHGSNILSRIKGTIGAALPLVTHGSRMGEQGSQVGGTKSQGPSVRRAHGLSNELTNFDIDEYLHKIKAYHGCFIKDELPELNPGFYVVNLNGNSHWTVLCKDLDIHGNPSYLYFDSFGFPAPLEVEQAIERDAHRKTEYVSMKNDLQAYSSTACGFFCIAFVKFLNKRKNKERAGTKSRSEPMVHAYEKFIALFDTDAEKNDRVLKDLI